MTYEEDIDLILFYLAESGLCLDLDREWMKAAYHTDMREERSNRTYYERILPWEATIDLIDPKSTSRIIDAIDSIAMKRLKSAENYVHNHAPHLEKVLRLVLKNGAERKYESVLSVLKTMLEEENLRRSRRGSLPKRRRPRLTWRGKRTKGASRPS